MTPWVNRTAWKQVIPASGQSDAVPFAAATAGNLLVCIVNCDGVSSLPTGWTSPSGGTAANNTGLYVWWKIATAGESFLVSNHDANGYGAQYVIYEFAAGSTFVKSVSSTNGNASAANPNLTGLSGSNLTMAAVGIELDSTTSTSSVSWSAGLTEDLDIYSPKTGSFNGYGFSLAYLENNSTSSFQPTGTITASGAVSTKEALTFAVKVASSSQSATIVAAESNVQLAVGTAEVFGSSKVIAELSEVYFNVYAASVEASTSIEVPLMEFRFEVYESEVLTTANFLLEAEVASIFLDVFPASVIVGGSAIVDAEFVHFSLTSYQSDIHNSSRLDAEFVAILFEAYSPEIIALVNGDVTIEAEVVIFALDAFAASIGAVSLDTWRGSLLPRDIYGRLLPREWEGHL